LIFFVVFLFFGLFFNLKWVFLIFFCQIIHFDMIFWILKLFSLNLLTNSLNNRSAYKYFSLEPNLFFICFWNCLQSLTKIRLILYIMLFWTLYMLKNWIRNLKFLFNFIFWKAFLIALTINHWPNANTLKVWKRKFLPVSIFMNHSKLILRLFLRFFNRSNHLLLIKYRCFRNILFMSYFHW